MVKEEMRDVICNWLSSLGYTRANSVKLADVDRLIAELKAQDSKTVRDCLEGK